MTFNITRVNPIFVCVYSTALEATNIFPLPQVWHRYDHLGRSVAWQDDQGNVTQFLYGDVRHPRRPTHIHYPKRDVTHALEYDQEVRSL